MLWTVEAPVTEVHAYSNKMSIPEFPSDDCYIVIMRFENGILGKVYVTSGCSGEGLGGGFLAVYGTEGTLWKGKLIRRGQETLKLEDTSAQSVVAGHGWGRSVIEFLDLLENKIANPIPARAGARTVAVCEAALQSIQTGHPQRPARF
jgi:predicted dehydrogenase